MKRTTAFLFVIFWSAVAWPSQNVVVVLDDSGSMLEFMRDGSMSRIEAASDALRTVLNELPSDAAVGVLALNGTSGDGEWLIPLGSVRDAEIDHATSRIRAQGGTPLGRFIREGTNALLQLREKQRYGDYRLLIITDGEANDASYLEAILPNVLNRNVFVDVIGVDMKTDHSLATKVDSYRRANDPESLTRAISESLAEVTSDADDAASQSDYALLNGISNDEASAVIAALVLNHNDPIPSEEEVYTTAEPASMDANHPRSSDSSETAFSIVGTLFFIGFALISVLVVVFNMTVRRRTR